MMFETKILKRAVIISFIIMISVFLLIVAKMTISRYELREEYLNLREAVSAGIIVDKKMENGYVSVFRDYTPPRYYLVVEWSGELNGETFKDVKKFEVEFDVYCSYELGEYFDSRNFK